MENPADSTPFDDTFAADLAMTHDARDTTSIPTLYGMMAEFETPEELLEAARAARAEGYTCIDAFSPFPIDGLAAALGRRATRLPFITLAGGATGALLGYGMQYFASVIHYPYNVGNRPYHSWPAFIPITFELTILCAAIASVVGMFALNGLPRPYHPVFNADRFTRASQDRFFLLIEAADPKFHPDAARRFLQEHGAFEVMEVEP